MESESVFAGGLLEAVHGALAATHPGDSEDAWYASVADRVPVSTDGGPRPAALGAAAIPGGGELVRGAPRRRETGERAERAPSARPLRLGAAGVVVALFAGGVISAALLADGASRPTPPPRRHPVGFSTAAPRRPGSTYGPSADPALPNHHPASEHQRFSRRPMPHVASRASQAAHASASVPGSPARPSVIPHDSPPGGNAGPRSTGPSFTPGDLSPTASSSQ
jgi:hypothetical protein